MAPTRHVIVGYDDSRGARAALRWALDDARRDAARVTLVHAFLLEVAWIDRSDIERWTEMERQAATTGLARVVDELRDAGVELDGRVVEGHPVEVLIDASRDANLLVVGSRGRGALTGLLVGSVSQRCLERARCPVVVVPHSA